jgi:hypothetical protein
MESATKKPEHIPNMAVSSVFESINIGFSVELLGFRCKRSSL